MNDSSFATMHAYVYGGGGLRGTCPVLASHQASLLLWYYIQQVDSD